MSRPFITVFDAQTQEEVTREMNNEEFEQYEIDKAEWEAKQTEV